MVIGTILLSGSSFHDDLSDKEKELLIKDAKEKLASGKLVTTVQQNKDMTWDPKSKSVVCTNCKSRLEAIDFGSYCSYVTEIVYCNKDKTYFIRNYSRLLNLPIAPLYTNTTKFPEKDSSIDTQQKTEKKCDQMDEYFCQKCKKPVGKKDVEERHCKWPNKHDVTHVKDCTELKHKKCNSTVAIAGDNLQVHEWGVFMFYQGVGCDLLTAPTEYDLPDFIVKAEKKVDLTSPESKNCPYCKTELTRCKCPRIYYHKPIINFYTPSPAKVNVSINLTKGELGVWYPKHTSTSKDNKSLVWNELVLTTAKPESGLKNAKGSSWWDIARDTESAYVVTKDGNAEKFLFYEGEIKGLHQEIQFKKDGKKVMLTAKVPNTYKGVFVVQDKKIYFVDELSKSKEITLAGGDISLKEAKNKLEEMLVKEGLNEKEAIGIVKICEDTFYKDGDLKVIYMMSREEVDKALPLEITPKPKKLSRAMIACICDLESIIKSLIKRLGDKDQKVRRQGSKD